MPVSLPLAKLVELDGKDLHKLWPAEFKSFILAIHNEATGRANGLSDEAKETLEAIGIEAPTTAAEQSPDQHPLPGLFDRTTCVAMGEWAKEQKEHWLEMACKFLIRNRGVRIVVDRRSYGNYFKFESLPKGWSITSRSTIAELIFALAEDIEERLSALGD